MPTTDVALAAGGSLPVPERIRAFQVLSLNTLAFLASFAVWMLNGVLVTFLVDNGVFPWTASQMGWLLAAPVLTGSIMRLPVGVLTDKYGGRIVFTLVMVVAAASCFLLSYARDFTGYFVASLGFGMAGATFAVGIAYTSLWFRKEHQGTALGIFGAGNAGSAITSFGAPLLLVWLTRDGLEGWRQLPQIYAACLFVMAIGFWSLTYTRVASAEGRLTLASRLLPLRNVRVWRFGLYYFFVFGGFVALAQWLIPYYVTVYGASIVLAGLLATVFNLPSGVIRALGGWMSDLFGARRVMYWVFGTSLLCCLLLIFPRMEVYTPGRGVMNAKAGVVTSVAPDRIQVGERSYPVRTRQARPGSDFAVPGVDERLLIWPTVEAWQEPVVAVGQKVAKKQLLARGVSHVYFQANVWIFTFLVFLLGIAMGIGKAGVYKYIPDYFPQDVGVVGGMVGVIGGLGGFFCPVVFGYLLEMTGVWTTCWAFFALAVLVCLAWLHHAVSRLTREHSPHIANKWELGGSGELRRQ
ncbi:MAG: NarK/NasA family nitrate transporter [Candidatus Sericytochromatia bacterium]|nr:NarK/NasA family nitrate transporter [Candidatus Tanganyikabacteria bacterium]